MTIPRPYPADFPGVTTAWLASANRCSPRTVSRLRAALQQVSVDTTELLATMTTEQGVEMALLRPPRGVLPYWSRLAIAELAHHGATYRDLMALFQVSRSTVYRAIHHASSAYCPLSGRRQLTQVQAAKAASLQN